MKRWRELAGLKKIGFSFTGFLDEADKSLLLHSAELCIIPSLYEPFGLVALEAMASGTPLIVSDTGGLAEIVRSRDQRMYISTRG